MTQDEIIRMAREAGFSVGLNDPIIYAAHERFAALVAAHEREKQAEQEPVAWAYIDADGSFMDALDRQHGAYQTPLYAAPVSIEAAVLAEREACAKVCDTYFEERLGTADQEFGFGAYDCSNIIKSRGGL